MGDYVFGVTADNTLGASPGVLKFSDCQERSCGIDLRGGIIGKKVGRSGKLFNGVRRVADAHKGSSELQTRFTVATVSFDCGLVLNQRLSGLAARGELVAFSQASRRRLLTA